MSWIVRFNLINDNTVHQNEIKIIGHGVKKGGDAMEWKAKELEDIGKDELATQHSTIDPTIEAIARLQFYMWNNILNAWL